MPLGEYTEVCRGAKGGEVVYTQLIPWWPQLRRNYAVFTEACLLHKLIGYRIPIPILV